MSLAAQSQRKTTPKQRRQKRRQQQNNHDVATSLNFDLQNIKPLTNNQILAFDSYHQGNNLMLTGTPGTGKSFIGCFLAMEDILTDHRYNKLIIVRSIVSSRDPGALPGDIKQKSKIYEAPYGRIFSKLFDRGDAYQYLKSRDIVEFETTSFIRGCEWSDCIVFVDEFQNMTASELHTVITRVGENCKVIFAGDIKQLDHMPSKQQSGFKDFFTVIDNIRSFVVVEFDRNDIVRSGLVKEYIIARETLEDTNVIARM